MGLACDRVPVDHVGSFPSGRQRRPWRGRWPSPRQASAGGDFLADESIRRCAWPVGVQKKDPGPNQCCHLEDQIVTEIFPCPEGVEQPFLANPLAPLGKASACSASFRATSRFPRPRCRYCVASACKRHCTSRELSGRSPVPRSSAGPDRATLRVHLDRVERYRSHPAFQKRERSSLSSARSRKRLMFESPMSRCSQRYFR